MAASIAAARKAAAKKAPAKKAPGKDIAKVAPKKVDTGDFTPTQAKMLTKRITDGVTTALENIVKAYKGRIWLALGYKSWDEYRQKEFGDVAPLALPLVQRRAAVKKMAEEGMSSRAIATMTGTDQKTAVRDQHANAEAEAELRQDASVDGEDNVIEGEVVSEDESSRTVTGLDGKERTVTTKPKATTQVNIVSEARSIAKDLDKVRVRLGELYDREDYEENAPDVDGTLQQVFDDFVDEVGMVRLGLAEAEPELPLEDPEPEMAPA